MNEELAQTAINCYLSTMLSATECIAQVFPSAGIPYRNRWRRVPQRIGFDLSPQSLEASARMFHSELTHFAELASRLYGEGLNFLERVGSEGAKPFEGAIKETASHANLLDELAESLEKAADLGAAPEIRGMLFLQSEGLRRSARQLRGRLLPELDRIASLISDCQRIRRQVEEDLILDPITGFVNSRGFRHELKCRCDESRDYCVLLIDCVPRFESGRECPEGDFDLIAADLAGRLGDQFRPWDCLGRIGPRRLAVIFEGSQTVAKTRSEQILRSISGAYSHGISLTANIEVVDASEAASLLSPESVLAVA